MSRPRPSLQPRFPPTIPCGSLGQLTLDESQYEELVFRCYVLDRQITVGRHKDVRVIAWPPDVGVSDAGKLANFISAVVRRIDEQLDRIVADSLPIIESEILAFCEPSETYHPPSAEVLMAESKLTMLKINADGEHEIEFDDRAGLVGGHDILIQLDSTPTPTYAYMDG